MTMWPNGEAGDCNSPYAGSIPAIVSKLPWLEWTGSGLLNRHDAGSNPAGSANQPVG